MAGKFVKAVNSNQVCIDCGCKIKRGEEYWYRKTNKKTYTYCKSCKNKPKHNRTFYDYESIIRTLNTKPLFQHEFNKEFRFASSNIANKTIRKIQSDGYPINIFRWDNKIKNRGRYVKSKAHNIYFNPNKFIIYFIDGNETDVLKRIFETFEFNEINWKALLNTLFGKKPVREIYTKYEISYIIKHGNIELSGVI